MTANFRVALSTLLALGFCVSTPWRTMAQNAPPLISIVEDRATIRGLNNSSGLPESVRRVLVIVGYAITKACLTVGDSDVDCSSPIKVYSGPGRRRVGLEFQTPDGFDLNYWADNYANLGIRLAHCPAGWSPPPPMTTTDCFLKADWGRNIYVHVTYESGATARHFRRAVFGMCAKKGQPITTNTASVCPGGDALEEYLPDKGLWKTLSGQSLACCP
jgi:hypothetical protein